MYTYCIFCNTFCSVQYEKQDVSGMVLSFFTAPQATQKVWLWKKWLTGMSITNEKCILKQ